MTSSKCSSLASSMGTISPKPALLTRMRTWLSSSIDGCLAFQQLAHCCRLFLSVTKRVTRRAVPVILEGVDVLPLRYSSSARYSAWVTCSPQLLPGLVSAHRDDPLSAEPLGRACRGRCPPSMDLSVVLFVVAWLVAVFGGMFVRPDCAGLHLS
jgi:hypothetical protein